MARKDRLGPVQLLGDQPADQLVRPGHAAECENQIGPLEDAAGKPLGAADQDRDSAEVVLLPSAQESS